MAEPLQDQNDDVRESWTVGSKVEVYSSSSKQWYKGAIVRIFMDEEGEWLEVQYKADKFMRVKEVPREDKSSIRPLLELKEKDDDDEKEPEEKKKKEKITLNIKTISNIRYTVCVESDCTIGELKKEIEKVCPDKINPLLQKLLYNGIQLADDDKKINDKSLDIKDERTIILVRESPKQMVLTFKTLQSKFYDLEVCSIDTILQIKQAMHKKFKIAESKDLNLIYQGVILKDDETAKSTKLKEKDYILVLMKKKSK